MTMLPQGVAALLLGLAILAPGVATPGRAATLDWGDGVNLQPSYYHGGQVDLGWDLMKRHDRIRTVRIEIEPRIPIATASRWIREAHAQGYRVIATYHRSDLNGSDNVKELVAAARWWRAHYAELSASGPVIVNVMNEWGSHRITAEDYANAYNAALAIIRQVHAGPVVVDVPGWGQEVNVACAASKRIKDANVVFSVHVYSSAWVEQGARRWMAPSDLDRLAGCGRPVMMGEFGGGRTGGANWSALVDRARELGWPLLAWAWNGDGEGMNMTQPLWGSEPAPTAFTTTPYFEQVYAKLRK